MSEIVHFLQFLREVHPWAMRVWFFGFGACVGSFLNVCILRIPAGRSIVFPGSTCACGKPIAPYDNIPILSWFILRGRARCCGAKFSIRYPLVEAATAAAYLWLWVHYSPTSLAMAFAGMILYFLLLFGAMVDYDHLVLPDLTTIGGLFIGLGLSLLWPQLHGQLGGWSWPLARNSAWIALTGAVGGAGVVYWIGEFGNYFLRRPSMGYGDMLLMGCVGAFCGWRGTLASIFGGAILACIFMVPLKLFAKREEAPAESPAVEAAEYAVEAAPLPLGRRTFAMDYLMVLAVALGAIAWLIHAGAPPLAYAYPALIALFALWKRSKLGLNEAWLLLAVVVAIIVSALLPRLHGLSASGVWIMDALPGVLLASLGATIGAGVALWLLELANLSRMYLLPDSIEVSPLANYEQIWGEGYLLLFGGIGAFGGWRATLAAGAVFVVAGAIKGISCLLRARSAPKPQAAAVDEKSPAETPAENDAFNTGLEIPFGPWLAFAAFLYFAGASVYFDHFLNTARAVFMGEMPGQ